MVKPSDILRLFPIFFVAVTSPRRRHRNPWCNWNRWSYRSTPAEVGWDRSTGTRGDTVWGDTPWEFKLWGCLEDILMIILCIYIYDIYIYIWYIYMIYIYDIYIYDIWYMIYLFGESLSPIGAPIGAIASCWSGFGGNPGEVDGVLQKFWLRRLGRRSQAESSQTIGKP